MDGLAIMGCSDDTLKTNGIRKFGDIAALRGFASQKVFSGGNSSCRESCKKELANAVRTAKFFYKDSKINKKEYARVQIGWKTYNQNEGNYVFQRKVGGSCIINIKKNANETDIKDIALPLFFPGGKSDISQKHNFTHRIGNFRGEPLLNNFSLADYICEHKLTHVRLYLLSKKKTSTNRIQDILDDEFSDSNDFGPEKSFFSKSRSWRISQ